MSCFTKLSLINDTGNINQRIERRKSNKQLRSNRKSNIMFHWYCKSTYDFRQFFYSKLHIIWDGENISYYKISI